MPSRLDALVVARGLAADLARATAEIRAGNVLVDEVVADKPGHRVAEGASVRLRRPPAAYVSRGGGKLAAALDNFSIGVEGRVCADLGASTGGFTDCLLQRGAEKVYAVDVGYGQLDWRLRTDARVVVMERTNVRLFEGFPEPVGLVVADLSFISLRTVLPTIYQLVAPAGEAVLLVKPQFEVGRSALAAGGRVLNESDRAKALDEVVELASKLGFEVRGAQESPVPGRKSGNREWLLWLGKQAA